MFNRAKRFLDMTFTYKPYIGRTGTGDKKYGDIQEAECYAEGSVKVVKNDAGTEVLSTTQLYVNGDVDIKELDLVSFNGTESEVKAVSTYYAKGKAQIKVVYL